MWKKKLIVDSNNVKENFIFFACGIYLWVFVLVQFVCGPFLFYFYFIFSLLVVLVKDVVSWKKIEFICKRKCMKIVWYLNQSTLNMSIFVLDQINKRKSSTITFEDFFFLIFIDQINKRKSSTITFKDFF